MITLFVMGNMVTISGEIFLVLGDKDRFGEGFSTKINVYILICNCISDSY